MQVIKVTADTNIYLWALNFGGKPQQLLELARAGKIEIAISNAIITEISRILYNSSTGIARTSQRPWISFSPSRNTYTRLAGSTRFPLIPTTTECLSAPPRQVRENFGTHQN